MLSDWNSEVQQTRVFFAVLHSYGFFIVGERVKVKGVEEEQGIFTGRIFRSCDYNKK